MADGGTWRDDPELAALSNELRAGVGGELRAEAEEGEQLASMASQRARSLIDVAGELVVRGDGVQLVAGGRSFVGEVIHAAGELLSLGTPAGRVDAPTSAVTVLTVSARPDAAGRDLASSPSTLVARLRELELAEATVELGIPGFVDGELTVRLDVVAVDHVVASGRDGQRFVVPLSAIAWVVTRPGV